MQKRLIKVTLMSFFVLLLISLFAFGQQTGDRIKEDGPVFHGDKTSNDPGILFLPDGAQLSPQIGIQEHDYSTDPLKIDGIYWTYPIQNYAPSSDAYIDHATDVDDIDDSPENQFYLITDLNNNKVFTYNRTTGRAIWVYKNSELAGPVDADYFIEQGVNRVLITYYTQHVVLKIDHFTQNTVWSYGKIATAGEGFNELRSPSDAEKIEKTGEYLIADTGNRRVIIVDESKNIVWQLKGENILKTPVDVEYDENNDRILITDQDAHKVLLADRDGNIIWSFGTGSAGDSEYQLNSPADADFLSENRIIIADKGNNRILEVDITDPDYFWTFATNVQDVEDVDAADNNCFLVARNIGNPNQWLPTLLKFESDTLVSPVYEIDQQDPAKVVNFKKIFWDSKVDKELGTLIRLQFRSAIDRTSLPDAQWYGSQNDSLFVTGANTDSASLILGKHDIHKVYQFRTQLITSNPKETPFVNSLGVKYAFYDTTKTPYIWTRPIIGENKQNTTINWKSLKYWTVLPENRKYLNDVEFAITINDVATSEKVHPTIQHSGQEEVTILLSEMEGLLGVKDIYIVFKPITHNTALTPILSRWQVIWEEVKTQKSTVTFTDALWQNTDLYTAAKTIPKNGEKVRVDKVNLVVKDNISIDTTPEVVLDVLSESGNDSEQAHLTYDVTLDVFKTQVGIPIIVTDDLAQISQYNDTLEVFDRELLTVSYTDPNEFSDISQDSIIVREGSIGALSIENAEKLEITKALLEQSIYFRVRNESDKNLDPAARDSIYVTAKNFSTADSERVMLYEIADGNGIYNTGEFYTDKGVQLKNNPNLEFDDGIIYSRNGDVIHAIYRDNFAVQPTTKFITIPTDDYNIYVGAEPIQLDVAPNPYYANLYQNFRMRIASSIGALSIRYIEVFNLAGEKVRKIDASELRFTDWGTTTIEKNKFGIIEYWWDMSSDTGHQISSGTYWVKLHADVLNESTNTQESVTALRKFVVVR